MKHLSSRNIWVFSKAVLGHWLNYNRRNYLQVNPFTWMHQTKSSMYKENRALWCPLSLRLLFSWPWPGDDLKILELYFPLTVPQTAQLPRPLLSDFVYISPKLSNTIQFTRKSTGTMVNGSVITPLRWLFLKRSIPGNSHGLTKELFNLQNFILIFEQRRNLLFERFRLFCFEKASDKISRETFWKAFEQWSLQTILWRHKYVRWRKRCFKMVWLTACIIEQI